MLPVSASPRALTFRLNPAQSAYYANSPTPTRAPPGYLRYIHPLLPFTRYPHTQSILSFARQSHFPPNRQSLALPQPLPRHLSSTEDHLDTLYKRKSRAGGSRYHHYRRRNVSRRIRTHKSGPLPLRQHLEFHLPLLRSLVPPLSDSLRRKDLVDDASLSPK